MFLDGFSAEDDVVEVQGVTRRGATDQQNQQGLEFDESEFVAASEGMYMGEGFQDFQDYS